MCKICFWICTINLILKQIVLFIYFHLSLTCSSIWSVNQIHTKTCFFFLHFSLLHFQRFGEEISGKTYDKKKIIIIILNSYSCIFLKKLYSKSNTQIFVFLIYQNLDFFYWKTCSISFRKYDIKFECFVSKLFVPIN